MGSQHSQFESDQSIARPAGAGSFDPGQALFNEAYSGDYLRGATTQVPGLKDGGGDPTHITFDPMLGGPIYRPDIKLDPFTTGDSGGDPSKQPLSKDGQVLEKSFDQMNAGQLSSIITSLPDSERDAVIAALPQKDQQKYFDSMATMNMIDLQKAEESALASLPKEDLAKAMGEVMSDPSKYNKKPELTSTPAWKPDLTV